MADEPIEALEGEETIALEEGERGLGDVADDDAFELASNCMAHS